MDWNLVLERLEQLASIEQLPDGTALWRANQHASLRWMVRRLREEPGVLVADEVGLGKTRLAVALAVCVAASGGRVAVLIPPGLAYQWQDEELRGFLAHLSTLSLPWLPDVLPHRFLRTYADLFADGSEDEIGSTNDSPYPLADAYPILFISHGFGLPPVGKVVNQELWALPYLAKKAAGFDAYGAGKLAVSAMQECAARYIGAHGSAGLRRRLGAATLGRPVPEAFKDEQHAELFRNVIGELLGNFDLLIIDEAHKSRAGADLSLAEKQAQGKLRSRLTKLIDSILMADSRAKPSKRVALTATPMELGVDQWKAIFSRLGLGAERVVSLGKVVERFADAVDMLRSGSQVEIDELKEAASEFQGNLRDIVTRRLWRDHPLVKRYSESPGVHNRAYPRAHPHREYITHSLVPACLPQEERRKLALSEALSAAARGASVGHELKTAGIRFSQALPNLPEAVRDKDGDGKQKNECDETAAPVALVADPATHARLQRCEYWRAISESEDHKQLGKVGADPHHALQWHPRVRKAVRLIEKLANGKKGEKVLVFGEYLASLHALNRSLNIRHYLQHLRNETPIPLPVGVHANDADIQRWRLDPEFGLAAMSDEEFEKKAQDFSERYEREREQLRDVCKQVVEEVGLASKLSVELAGVLITWLIQQLCVADQLWRVDVPDQRDCVRAEARKLLSSLHDPDPPEDVDEQKAERNALSWNRIVEQLKHELQCNQNGDYVFRMSPFAQLMIGDTKPATRRARQGTFNHPSLNPRVLLGQADVMSEGLNLHRACRTVVLFHLDWNPGRIEQQIGRVDRQNSAWMNACEEALRDREMPLPTIKVYTLAVQGTYDDLRSSVVQERVNLLRAQLFGEVLSPERLAQLPLQAQELISDIHVDFRPEC
ncbi:DEAD/DEAH box helicase [Burkholderia sp. Ac-20379]|uniref:DEAD/DEAH box helicase n=1 Tax=Burkholderia sp. Ac-20379 TaxID=2703900 RepID=UPI00197F8133|nr:DEAD/DEAH box helicase [Burkholderia sp. Ac-20379]MBN3722601.1 DEAD/DEAH box helicase [Burkholderia sp. Ac-20379]